MTTLETLKNSSRKQRTGKRVGRGIGSGKGKTCGRGEKGAGARSGYKRRFGYEGGQFRTFMKLPQRGFNNARFRETFEVVNLGQIDAMYEDGEVVNAQTLTERGFLSCSTARVKILGKGELKKKVKIEAHAVSSGAKDKLQKAKVAIKLPE